ncbi:hypothetical protein BofuT4_uP117520.1 [Botrytis cinerea T4]|uniref:Uncharacterized protein n=1 Tax=Botryotinia fuckeliana (strain T4) TaxID=999810 RepID=G2Y0N7_BOTF4|nr:hypothetical protein BofuT4_uP117520.1 [Botrytis cinerea T4]
MTIRWTRIQMDKYCSTLRMLLQIVVAFNKTGFLSHAASHDSP